jgi:hypothetical protein
MPEINLSTAGGQYGGLIAVGGVTGYSLWGLLGRQCISPSSPIYRAITTTTPPGDNGKNAGDNGPARLGIDRHGHCRSSPSPLEVWQCSAIREVTSWLAAYASGHSGFCLQR